MLPCRTRTFSSFQTSCRQLGVKAEQHRWFLEENRGPVTRHLQLEWLKWMKEPFFHHFVKRTWEKNIKGIVASRSAMRICKGTPSNMKSWDGWTGKKLVWISKKRSNWQRLWWIVFFRRKVLTCSSCVNAPRHLKGWVTFGRNHLWCSQLVVVRWSQSCAVEKWMVAFTCCIAIQGPGTSWQRGVSNCWMLRQLRLTKVCLCKSRRCECLFLTFQAILAASLAWGRGALF